MLGRAALVLWAALVIAVHAGSATAAIGGLPTNTGDQDGSAEWDKVRQYLFQDRPIRAFPSLVEIEVPRRAAFGASVPVAVRTQVPQSPDLYVKRIYLVIDKNPSPVAATFEFTPEAGIAEIETRIRVQEYSHVRAIAEFSDGQLHMDARYAKISGGCTQPPNRDQTKHMSELGQMKFRLGQSVKVNEVNPVTLQVSHPQNSGFELNQITVMYIPPHYVRTVEVTYADKPILNIDMDFSISEDPYFRFNFVPHGPGELKAHVVDSKEQHFEKATPVTVMQP